MDDFKKCQYNYLGPGGFKCKCCNKLARNNGGKKKDKTFTRMVRARFKQKTDKLINKILNG